MGGVANPFPLRPTFETDASRRAMRSQRFKSLGRDPSNNCRRRGDSPHRFAMLANARMPAPLKRIRCPMEVSSNVSLLGGILLRPDDPNFRATTSSAGFTTTPTRRDS